MKNSILIIDDDQLVRESLFEVLSHQGYDVAMASDGSEGLAKLGEKDFDLALVDMRLPSAMGIDILKETKERFPEIDVVMMTGFGTVETAVEAMKFGASDYLTKPINDDEIRMLLRRIFDLKKLKVKFDLIIANELRTLPLALRFAGGKIKVHFDAHELYTLQNLADERPDSEHQMDLHLFKRYVRLANSISTISFSIAHVQY